MQHFKDKIYNYETEPPAGVWNQISRELQAAESTKIISITKHTNRSKFVLFAAAAVVTIIVLIIFSTYTSTNQASEVAMQQKDSMRLNNQALEEIIAASKENKPVINDSKILSKIKKYITIAGPEGQAVKISPKVATLIVSADNAYPPKAVWNKKIEKWKQIMLTSTQSTTSTNLLDVVQNSSAAIDSNE